MNEKTNLIRKDHFYFKKLRNLTLKKSDQQFDFIENNINYIKKIFKNEFKIYKSGNYKIANKDLFPIQEEDGKTAYIDLLAVKYISKSLYRDYETRMHYNIQNGVEHVVQSRHAARCLICNYLILIKQIIVKQYSNVKNIEVKTKDKKIFANNRWLIYSDSMQIIVSSELGQRFEKIIFTIRPCLKAKDYPVLICNNSIMERSFVLEYLDTFKKLNSGLNSKLKLLFFEIDLGSFTLRDEKDKIKQIDEFSSLFNRKQKLFIKILFMGHLINKIITSKEISVWIDIVSQNYLNDIDRLKKVFNDKNFRYKKIPLFDKIYSLFKLEKLQYVTFKKWPSYVELFDEFKKFISKIYDINTGKFVREILNPSFLLENQVRIDIDQLNQSYTIKSDKKYYDDINVKIDPVYVYAKNSDTNKIMVYSNTYRFYLYDPHRYIESYSNNNTIESD